MLVENCGVVVDIQKPVKRRKRHSSIYFSSAKVLRRSRMTRGKKAMSKRGQGKHGDIQRVL